MSVCCSKACSRLQGRQVICKVTLMWTLCLRVEGHLSLAVVLLGGGSLMIVFRPSRMTKWVLSLSNLPRLSDMSQALQHLALTTFIFPDSLSSSSQLAPLAEAVPIPADISARRIPSTPNVLSAISQDSSLSFSIPYTVASDFLKAVQEIPGRSKSSNGNEDKMWIMKAARFNGHGSRRTYRAWLSDGWSSFVDLVKVCILSSIGCLLLTTPSMLRP